MRQYYSSRTCQRQNSRRGLRFWRQRRYRLGRRNGLRYGYRFDRRLRQRHGYRFDRRLEQRYGYRLDQRLERLYWFLVDRQRQVLFRCWAAFSSDWLGKTLIKPFDQNLDRDASSELFAVRIQRQCVDLDTDKIREASDWSIVAEASESCQKSSRESRQELKRWIQRWLSKTSRFATETN